MNTISSKMPTPEEIAKRIKRNTERYASVRARLLEAQQVVDEIRREAAPVIEALVHDDVRTLRMADGRTVTFRRDPRNGALWLEIEKDPVPTIGA